MTTAAFAGTRHASVYIKFRPKANPEVISRILQFLKEKHPTAFSISSAVDVACGSGQCAVALGEHFDSVLGCDVSEAQINEAKKANESSNINYCVADAEHLPVEDNSVDLVTCSQAAHWLNFPAFCEEAYRILKPSGCLAVFFRNHRRLLHDDYDIEKKINELFSSLMLKTLAPYWNYSVHPIEWNGYVDLTIGLPYIGFERDIIFEHKDLSLSELAGFVETVSAYQKYHKEHPEKDILSTFQKEIHLNMTSSFKDRFKGENHAILYRKYRPKASPLVINKILEFMKEKETSSFQFAVDVACGSGQSTQDLGEHFESVMGCDISEAQIDQAKKFSTSPNIKYCVADTLDLPVEDNSVDLVTCSEAAHWFDLPAFFKEVDRILKPSGCLAVYIRMFIGVVFPHEDKQISSRLRELHRNFRINTLKDYCGVSIEQDEVIYNEDLVKAVTYQECQRHTMFEHKDMPLSELLGYFESLSCYQKYHEEHPDDDILNQFKKEIMQTLGIDKPPDEIILKTKCPIYLLLGRKPSSS